MADGACTPVYGVVYQFRVLSCPAALYGRASVGDRRAQVYGRAHQPSVDTHTPLGIIQPFRNLGGMFDLGWPHLGEVLALRAQRGQPRAAGVTADYLITILKATSTAAAPGSTMTPSRFCLKNANDHLDRENCRPHDDGIFAWAL